MKAFLPKVSISYKPGDPGLQVAYNKALPEDVIRKIAKCRLRDLREYKDDAFQPRRSILRRFVAHNFVSKEEAPNATFHNSTQAAK